MQTYTYRHIHADIYMQTYIFIFFCIYLMLVCAYFVCKCIQTDLYIKNLHNYCCNPIIIKRKSKQM